MKKMMSSILIGLIATTATMSTMAAPAFEHKNPNPAAHFDQKPMPPKGDFRKAPPKERGKGFFKQERHDKFDKKDHRDQFAKKEHKGFFSKDKKHKPMPDHKAPPMPPKHR